MKALKEQQIKLDDMAQKFRALQSEVNICIVDSFAPYMLAYNEVSETYRKFAIEADKFSKVAVSVQRQATAAVMALNAREAFAKIKSGYDSKMGYDKVFPVPVTEFCQK